MWYWERSRVPGRSSSASSDESAGSERSLPDDVQHAVALLSRQIADPHSEVAAHFDAGRPLAAARAPGRLDVMGGIADYSGSTVLQLPLAESAVVLCQTLPTPEVRIFSVERDQPFVLRSFSAPVSDFLEPDSGRPCSMATMRRYFQSRAADERWAAYVAGVLTVLAIECNLRLRQGIALYVYSTVPEGKGVSSSAALEVAAMRAVTLALDLSLSAHRQAVLCQQVENHVVGAPCGLMDQMTSSMGRRGSLLTMLCQPDIVQQPVRLPEALAVWGIDSGLRHAVSGADYVAVRVAAFMGYRFLLEYAGLADASVPAAAVVDTRWHGYLANVAVSDFLEHFADRLPRSLSGGDYLRLFDATTDAVTSIDANLAYAVRACTAHPIHEHYRVRLFAQLAGTAWSDPADASPAMSLPEQAPAERHSLLGECMYQSHASYSLCGLGSSGTDDLVVRLKRIGVQGGIYGARITGGGNGGTVAVLADADAGELIRAVAAEYAAEGGIGGQVFSGSSDGASSRWLSPVSRTGP